MGTVPIPRTKNDDVIQGKSLLNDHILVQDLSGIHLAEVSLKPHFGPYYGVKGTNSIYNPRVDTKFQISMSHLWVQNGPIESTNKISLGWHVIPQLYGDYGTHYFTSWTSDNYKKTGCYNIECAGFVQTSKELYPGIRLGNLSVYGGPTYAASLSISQDKVTKNWWISIENKFIGYFPAKLFSNMSSADEVGWGGRTRTHPGTHSPQMGSGYFPDNNVSHACFFKQISIQHSSRKSHGPKSYETHSFSDNPNCYDVRYYGDTGPYYGYTLLFGGPDGNCGT
ncbi:uncharacterized protein LOC106774694 [Vigna radiata var. radiata]|uniref:Uncharacterized protein LOC106774694 n=1 Tax=Vigna radiata var. radiata TaxID=3916 RepID=A0A3Q0FGT9_VIGRR|nr:uncharacterized protein LOC106774694 [Vigna radiata var. radiata]